MLAFYWSFLISFSMISMICCEYYAIAVAFLFGCIRFIIAVTVVGHQTHNFKTRRGLQEERKKVIQ